MAAARMLRGSGGPPHDEGRPGEERPQSVTDGDNHTVPQIADSSREPVPVDSYLDHFVMRLLTEAIEQQTRAFWLKRAQDFLDARPRAGEYHGKKTPEQLREAWRRLTQIANACRARAQVAPIEVIDPDVRNVWDEVAS
jgi:hypothetical protein